MELSVIIPVYNQQENIGKNLIKLKNCLSGHFKDFEIIVVNDGSSDSSLKILKSISFIRLISYVKNRGKGYAIRRGVMAAKGKYIFYTDADLSYFPEDICRAVKILEDEKSDGIIGVRCFKKEDYSILRRFFSNSFSFFVNNILKLDAEDSQCGFKGFEKSCARNIFPRLTVFRFGFDVELLLEAQTLKLKLSKIPVRFVHFPSTSVKIFKDSGEMALSILKLRFRRLRLENYRQRK